MISSPDFIPDMFLDSLHNSSESPSSVFHSKSLLPLVPSEPRKLCTNVVFFQLKDFEFLFARKTVKNGTLFETNKNWTNM